MDKTIVEIVEAEKLVKEKKAKFVDYGMPLNNKYILIIGGNYFVKREKYYERLENERNNRGV